MLAARIAHRGRMGAGERGGLGDRVLVAMQRKEASL